MPIPVSRHLSLILTLGLVALALPSIALEPRISKILPPQGIEHERNLEFGYAVAISDRWIAIGAPQYDLPGNDDAGAVFLYDARTGRFVRRLVADEIDSEGHNFGSALAICGDRLVVGAPNYFFRGTAYVFDLNRGTQLFRLDNLIGLANEGFGSAVAITPSQIAVSSPGYDGGSGRVFLFDATDGQVLGEVSREVPAGDDYFGSSIALCGDQLLVGAAGVNGGQGAAWLFDIAHPEFPGWSLLHALVPDDPSATDQLGYSVALDGGRALVGAFGNDGGSGNAILFDVTTGDQLHELTAAERSNGNMFGFQVALDGNLALVSEPRFDDGRGKVWAFDAASGRDLGAITPPDADQNFFGDRLAICGNAVVVGAPEDDGADEAAGAAYFIRPLAGPIPFETITKVRDFAPGTRDADFRNFLNPAIDTDGRVAFRANLMGPGSGGNRDNGVWFSPPGHLMLGTKSRVLADFVDGSRIRSVSAPITEEVGAMIVPTLLAGPGVNGSNNQALLRFDENSALPILRTGDPVGVLGGAVPRRLLETVQSRLEQASRTVTNYRLLPGVAEVERNSDSGILVSSNDGTVVDIAAREGEEVADVGEYRQFFGRAATSASKWFTHGGYFVPDGEETAIQHMTSSSMNHDGLYFFARQGQQADGLEDGQVFRAMLGEGHNENEFGLVKATVRGAGITGRNNEGVWLELNGGIQLVIQKGDPVDPASESSPVLNRILRFWPAGQDDLILLVKLRGRGVTAANDCAVLLLHWDGEVGEYETRPLMREGDTVCDWDCPRIRAIQRVEVDPIRAHYAIVASLSGAPLRNQALFVGAVDQTPNTAQSALVQPKLVLRKGTLHNTPHSESTRLRSIVMEPRLDRTGSGGKGLGQVMNENGELVLCLQFDNRAKLLVSGKP